ncbi:MAG: hypothetical protein BWK75_06865 [Candidatus Altiarchaeales archaeon A3]|nr:MAG: hypothetical protein BWK75_06865 [Candidatus Altiarchaeales archaeon A3]
MSLNTEKQKIIEQEGNVLVTANPGTGKTLLLACKYTDLIRKGIKPEQILCLTFTEKAMKEMESRIIKVVKEQDISMDISKLNVFTFHSYALDNIDENEILDNNLLRYSILKYIKDSHIMNYPDEYLIETIVPKMENLIGYLKSFGITPDKVDIAEAKNFLEGGRTYTKEEIAQFAEYFVDIFKHYEEIKNKKGVDYADLLLKFMALNNHRLFDYVLVDELQDVNMMEADIAIKSLKPDGNFFVVGDKKQAIFGFQGGSILNFGKFENSAKFVLSENFRSTNEILSYARAYFVSKTNDLTHKEELKDLCSAEDKTGPKPAIYEVSRDKTYPAACELARNQNGRTAILSRTNSQVISIAKELDARGINFSSTFFSSSSDARTHIINFLKGLSSSDVQDIKNAMFTPFFPCSLQDAFNTSPVKCLEEIYEKIPAFKELRERIKTVEDVNILFREKIIPVCISYGNDYLSAGIIMQAAYREAMSVLTDKNIESLISYLQLSDLRSQGSDVEKEKGIVLTTVHKAKGKEFDNVIYIPSKIKNNDNFQDSVVKGILKSKGINVEEELEEETLRINFVAFTRAKNKLFILTDKINDYLNDYAECGNIDANKTSSPDLNESRKRAFNLFVNGKFDDAKALLYSNDNWIKNFVKNYFESLNHVSYSSLPEKAHPYDYFVKKILGLKEVNATLLGSKVHETARRILSEEEYFINEDAKPYIENVLKLIEKIKEDYPDSVKPELKLEIQLSSLGFDSPLKFRSSIDAVFKKGDKYLIVDWKTNKDTDRGSNHRQQLEIYKKVFAVKENIPLDNINVAIGYLGLRNTINTGQINCELDIKQPVKSAFNTISEKIILMLSWINSPEEFFKAFIEEKDKVNDTLWKSVVEEYHKGEK